MRKYTREINIGNKKIGNNNPILIQSMLKFPLTEEKRAIDKINELEENGLDIIRAAIPNIEAAQAIPNIIKNINIPFVADIHFDYRLAIKSIQNGVDKLRINPGNIGGKDRIREVTACLKEYNIPVRIGINGGSLEKDLLEKYSSPTPQAMAESALRSIEAFNEFGYDNIVVSIKSSNVKDTVEANELFASKYDYPLHLGITEAGSDITGIINSSVGLGSLLLSGIGDTIRVSLTGDSLPEVKIAKEILTACSLRKEGVRIVSCPTCARCRTNTLDIVTKLKKETEHIKTPITVAVMGCAVNGPGEAKEADMGVACGDGNAVFFKNGKIVKSIKTNEILSTILDEINRRA